MLIKTQKLFSAQLAIKLTTILLAEQIVDSIGTQLWLSSGGHEGNPLFATQFNQTHSIIQFSLIAKFVLPLLLFPIIYFIFLNNNSSPKFDEFIRRFLIASIFAIDIFYIIILSWNIGLL